MTDLDIFRAVLQRKDGNTVTTAIEELSASDLPDGDVTVAVDYSTINYKDGMVLKGTPGLVRNYPHVPGIDFSGTVTASDNPDYSAGDKVVLTGWRVGEAHWGGYGQMARVKGDWLVPLPDGLDGRQAMAIGTAGFTAMLAVMALEDHGLTPDRGDVLVTGAAGGVGSVAVAILGSLGYSVVAGTGRPETHDYLTRLGATAMISRQELETPPKGPLSSERWAGAIDNVGGPILGNLLASMMYHGSCAAVGLAASPKLQATVLPFLLRGVNLLGIDSVMCPKPRRLAAWARLAKELPIEKLEEISSVATLDDLPKLADDILAGKVKGRVIIDVNA